MLRIRIGSAVLLAVLLPVVASAATFRGKSVDGRRFSASIMNDDFGAYPNVEVKFNGHNATVYFSGSTQIQLVLEDEDISDSRHIFAHDDRRGVQWEIDIRNLREAVEGAR